MSTENTSTRLCQHPPCMYFTKKTTTVREINSYNQNCFVELKLVGTVIPTGDTTFANVCCKLGTVLYGFAQWSVDQPETKPKIV
jgi:hypothetical protein